MRSLTLHQMEKQLSFCQFFVKHIDYIKKYCIMSNKGGENERFNFEPAGRVRKEI